MPIHKDIQVLERTAREQGWQVVITGGDHLKWTGPNGTLIFSAATPSDFRTIRNLKAKLSKAGLNLEDTAVTRRRKVRLVGGSERSSVTDWLDEQDHARSLVIDRARIVLELSDIASDADIRDAIMALSASQRKALAELVSTNDTPDKTCTCGKEFTGALFAHIHRKKCLVANGAVPIEPKIPATGRNGKKVRVSQQSVTMPDVAVPLPDNNGETTMSESAVETESAIVCSECDKTFATNQRMLAHKNIHRSWTCPDCGQEMSINGKGNHLRRCEASRTPNASQIIHCKYCHKKMQLRSLAGHQWQYCNAVKAVGIKPDPEKDWYFPHRQNKNTEVVPVPSEDDIAAVEAGADAVPHWVTPAPVLDDQPPVVAPASSKPTDDSDEELITVLLDLIFPDGFKARHLTAIGRWTECTATLLKEVRGK